MRYVSLDLETTGLDPETCQIIEFGAVVDDTSRPLDEDEARKTGFHKFVHHPIYTGEPYALAMNSDIFDILARKGHTDICNVTVLADHFYTWLGEVAKFYPCDHVVMAGKNFAGFDKPFLLKLPRFTDLIKLHHRSLDPGSLWVRSDDTEVPGTEECMRRAGISGAVAHTAIEDAIMVCRLIRVGLD